MVILDLSEHVDEALHQGMVTSSHSCAWPGDELRCQLEGYCTKEGIPTDCVIIGSPNTRAHFHPFPLARIDLGLQRMCL